MRWAVPGLAAFFLASAGLVGGQAADVRWIAHPTNILPEPDPVYAHGPKSGGWASDLQYHEGLWVAGDGFGGIWYSHDARRWRRAVITQGGRQRSMQNAPVRSITVAENGTWIATFLGGGGFAEPEAAKKAKKRAGQRAPIARSQDGIHWEVYELPGACGAHFSATDGKGTWIISGCETSILVSRDDGRTWNEKITGLSHRIEAQGHIQDVWVVGAGGGAHGGIFYSRDLESWHLAMRFPYRVAPKRTLKLNQTLLMTGTWSFIATSVDGVNWSLRHFLPRPSRSFIIQAGIWHPDFGYILGGKRGIIMQSGDLAQWKLHNLPKGSSTLGMAMNRSGEVYASGMGPNKVLMRHLLRE